MVAPRDYYADLELPPTADVTDVKKQYRKLALKYHPDRNPGREAEVNSQFLIIQTAHDVLTDPQRKAKFDVERGRTAAGRSSGVRGNPWADAGAQFPTPPRRNQPGRNAASGADRWNTRFSSGVPPTARQQTSANSQTRSNAAEAFQNMRAKPQAKGTAKGTKASAPPPTPPRTEGAKQRQQASFGNRKSGYQPHASSSGDEPPVTNNNYSARRPVPPRPQFEAETSETPKHHDVNTGSRVPDPLSQFRDNDDDRQQKSPYVSKSGEKTNPFDASMGQAAQQQNEASRQGDSDPAATPAKPTRKPSIFDLTGEEESSKSSAGRDNFARSSVDDINTSFVNDDGRTAWQFNAGGSTPTKSQPQASDEDGSGAAPPQPPRPDAYEQAKHSHDGGFRSDAWKEGFGSQTFAPPPRTNSNGSPSKTSRSSSKKTKSKAAGGDTTHNAILIDSEDEEDNFTWTGRNGRSQATKPAQTTDSPQAMDIDSPPASTTDSPQTNGVRNIHVEPSRPEWRSGHLSGTNDGSQEAPPKPAKVPVGGSEDTDEFQANFAEFRNVAPFANESGSGLKSFSSMKDELPFESKASAQIPIEKDSASPDAPQPLVLPDPPHAPRPPPTIGVPNMKTNDSTWNKYVQDFKDYVRIWDLFTGQVTDHFSARKGQVTGMRKEKGYGFLVSGDGECSEYFRTVQQDNDVRRRWNTACEEHEQRLREFMACRDKMATGSV